jgi:hypothetical protein
MSTSKDETAADSIPDFCRNHGFSRSLFYKLPPDERPKLIRVGKRQLISKESQAEWRRAREGRNPEAA